MEIPEIRMENSGASAVADAISIAAQNVAGRDLYIENRLEHRSVFSEINLGLYSYEHYYSPKFTNKLVTQLKEQRLLILTGSFGFDKEFFARHLGYCLVNDLPALKAKEWRATEDSPPDLAKEINEHEQPAVFVLNQAGPKEVRYNVEGIRKIAAKHGHFVIITSNLSLGKWDLQPHFSRQCAFDIPTRDLYEVDLLTAHLGKLFKEHKDKPVFEALPEISGGDTLITSRHTLNELASNFQTPEQVHLFVELLCHENRALSTGTIEDTLRQMNDTAESFAGKWFRTLNEKEKLLVLGASLLDGVYEDQFFLLMEEIVEHFWHYKMPSLRGLDYEDLDFLLTFFKFEEQSGGRQVFRSRFPDQRLQVVLSAWNSYRRHMMSAIPVIVKAGRHSSMKQHGSLTMFKGRSKKMALRSAVAELLSDVGMFSLPAVEENLLEYAATSDESLQRITAKAIARWRLFGKEAQMFEMLFRWQNDEKIAATIADILQARENDAGADLKKALLYIQSATLLTLSYAAEYDSPNRLHGGIIDLLNGLAAEESEFLNTRLNKIIPGIVNLHFDQLKPVLKNEWMLYSGLRKGILAAFRELSTYLREEVFAFLEECLLECMEDQSGLNRRREPTYRDQLLICVLEIYQELWEDTGMDIMTQKFLWSSFEKLYRQERRIAVREVLLDTISKMTAYDPGASLVHLKTIFTYADLRERQIILRGFTWAYMKQRSQMPDTGYIINIADVRYPAYVNTEAPRTDVEKILYSWLESEDEFERKLALLAFTRISADFDIHVRNAVPVLVSQATRASDKQKKTSSAGSQGVYLLPPAELEYTGYSWFTSVLLWWWLLFETPEDRAMLRDVLKIYMTHRPWFSSSAFITLAIRFRKSDEGIPFKIGKWLERVFQRI